MLDVNAYGVIALDEHAMTAIEGGDGGCKEVAYAIGYAIGWTAAKIGDAYGMIYPFEPSLW